MDLDSDDKNLFTVTTTYQIKYHTEKPVPIPEVIKSLQSLERLLLRTPKFIEAAFPDIDIIDASVYIKSVESGSLVDDFMLRFVFKGNKENQQKAKEVFEQIMSDNTVIKHLVAAAMGGLIVYGAMSAIPSGAPAANINAYNNTIINIGAEAGIEADTFKAILNSTSDKKTLAKEAVNAISPAKQDPEAHISMNGLPKGTIPKEVIAEVPSAYEAPQPTEKEESYSDVQILIRAVDADRRDQGWAGTVPGITDKRTKFIIGEDVDPESLLGKMTVNADIQVHSTFVKSQKKYVVKSIEIKKIY